MIQYRIEILPRYGTMVGVIWKCEVDEESSNEEAIGHIRLVDKIEEEFWTTTLNRLNKILSENETS